MTNFPTSKLMLNLYFIPEADKFLALPAMDELCVAARSEVKNLKISFFTKELFEELQPIPADTFLKLAVIHKNIYFKRVTMSADDLTRAIRVLPFLKIN